MPQILINNIIRQLHEIQEGSLWFDQCFKDKIGGLSEAVAITRPIPQLFSVAEHVSHMLAWRKECMLRFNGLQTDLMNSAEDWKDNTILQKIGWTALLQRFYDSTQALIDHMRAHDDSYLEIKFLDTEYNHHYLIEGIIQHDLYHMGQIGVTLKLIKN